MNFSIKLNESTMGIKITVKLILFINIFILNWLNENTEAANDQSTEKNLE